MWVCGSERVLVEEVVDQTRAAIDAPAVDYYSFAAGADRERDIWDAINQYSIDPTAKRLIVVRSADKLKSWGRLDQWLAASRSVSATYVLFVSDSPDFPYEPSREHPGKLSKTLKPYAAAIKARGKLVRCSPLRDEDLREYVRRRIEVSDLVLDYLLARVGGSVARLNNVLLQMEMFKGSLSRELVDLFCSPSPEESFTKALLFERKQQAFVNAKSLAPDEYSRTIGVLNSHLTYLGKMNKAVRARRTPTEIIRAGDIPAAFVREMLLSAKLYDEGKRNHCRVLLAIADDAVARGERVGVMEALISLW